MIHKHLLYWVIKESMSWCLTRFFCCFSIVHLLIIKYWQYSVNTHLMTYWLHRDLIHRWLIFFLVMIHPILKKKKSLLQSRRLNGDVDTGCNPFCCFSLIFTASWKKIVIPIVLGVPAILIPFAVYYYCRFYKKQDNNAVTVQQGSVHLKRPRGDKKNWTFELQRLS